MTRSQLLLATFLTAISHGAALAAEPSEPTVFTVLGLRSPDGPSVVDLAAQFREALSQQAPTSANISVLSEAEIRVVLGFPATRTSFVLQQIGDAESLFQQFALDRARMRFEKALQDLRLTGGEEGVWESTVTGHLLLGILHLAAQSKDATSRASSEFEAVLRVSPSFQPTGHLNDDIVLALFEKARAKVRSEPIGHLSVSCTTPCPDGFVWVEGAPGGLVNGAPITLPGGHYQVRVADRRDAPRLRSLNHEVQVNGLAETRLLVDLESEGSLDLAGGPALTVPNDPAHRLKVLQVTAQRLGRGKIMAVWLDPRYVHLAIADATSAKIERHAAVPAPSDGKLETVCRVLSQLALGSTPVPPSMIALPPALDDLPVPSPTQEPPQCETRPRPVMCRTAKGIPVVSVGCRAGGPLDP